MAFQRQVWLHEDLVEKLKKADELLSKAQGIEEANPVAAGNCTREAIEIYREVTNYLGEDSRLTPAEK